MSTDLYPLRFRPVYRDCPWGGDRIPRTFGRNEPPGIYAESWELSDRADGMSVVAAGPWAGRSLSELVKTLGPRLLGTAPALAGAPAFPLLIKIIDARERLSLQVHPDDESAARHGGEAKTEAWYLLDADPGARVFAGLRPGVSAVPLRAAVADGSVEPLLVSIPVKKGDAVFMPGGRVHAIDRGCLILEVQQNSNTTYRLFDWGRVGADRRPRELHIEKAFEVIRWDDETDARVAPQPLPDEAGGEAWRILDHRYFRLDRRLIRREWTIRPAGRTFQVLFVAEGAVRAAWPGGAETWNPGTTVLVPAGLAECALGPLGPASTFLAITGPDA
jgi:mannose-6-phosphate isomerase